MYCEDVIGLCRSHGILMKYGKCRNPDMPMLLPNFPKDIFSWTAHESLRKQVDWLLKKHCFQAFPNTETWFQPYMRSSYRLPFPLIHGTTTLFDTASLPTTHGYHVDLRLWIQLPGPFGGQHRPPCSKCGLFSTTSNCDKQKPRVFSKQKKKILVTKQGIFSKFR